MWYRANQIKLKLNEDKSIIPERICEKAFASGIERFEIKNWKIIKESIDARSYHEIMFVYTVDYEVENDNLDLSKTPDMKYYIPEHGRPDKRPVIVGTGPCGLFAALTLVEMGIKPIMIERGQMMDQRVLDVKKFNETGILDPNSNVQFGEGGAGTFSDGKLTTGIKDVRIAKVINELSQSGGGNEILYKSKPHIGTDRLRKVIKNMRKKLLASGVEIRFGCKLTNIIVREGKIEGVEINSNEIIDTNDVVLAIGHSARDTFKVLLENNITMEQKPFSIGVRIEHPQSLINKSQYKDESLSDILGPADYKLSWHCGNGRGVYTFCMCPGGEIIIASSEQGGVVTNGMSYNARNGNYANSALLVDVRTSDFENDDPLAGLEFQRKYEAIAYEKGNGYNAPSVRWKDFNGSDVEKCLPKFAAESIIEAMPHLGKKLKGFDGKHAVMKAVETRSSSPVRIIRDKQKMMSNITGLYPAGEGAGYAGGIVSSAVDGMKVAEAMGRRYYQKGDIS